MKTTDTRVTLFLADVRPLCEEKLLRKVYGMAAEERREKADRCRNPKAKAASLTVGLLAEYALRKYGCGSCRIGYAPGGQPLVRTTDGREAPVFISLSHSGDYAVCALARRPVGVDIQKIQSVRAGMLRHFFAQEERTAFREAWAVKEEDFLPEGAQEIFLRSWTAKESYMKLTGSGMAAGFANLTADLEKGITYPDGKREEAAVLREHPAPEGYFLTSCVHGSMKKNRSPEEEP